MKKIRSTILACCVAVLLTGHAYGMSSASYRIDDDVISSGGGDSASANYSNYATFGQSVDGGTSSSANYTNSGGYLSKEADLRNLLVTLAGAGTGTVSPDSGSILWTGSTGTAYYAEGATVTLTAAAGANSDFTGWSGACSGAGSCTIIMNADAAVTAEFNPNAYSISTAVSAGSGTITCTPNPVTPGDTSTCVIAPSPGYSITGVIVDGSSVGAPSTYPFTNVSANHSISASFGVSVYSLSVTTSGTGTGTITSAPAGINCGTVCSGGFVAGTQVTLTPAATNGSVFSGWGGACTGTGACTVTMTATPITASATFNDTALPTLVLSTLPDSSTTNDPVLNISGTVTDNMTVQSLVISEVTVTVNPDSTFSYAMVLSAGTNTITAVATDAAGNTSTDVRKITLDQKAPTLTILSPADNSTTNQPVSTVTGTVDETATVTVALNSGATQTAVMSGATFSTAVTLVNGMNTIDVKATDLAGNASSGKRTVTFDPTLPSVSITSPGHDIAVSQPTITITGTVTDSLTPATAVMSVDGVISALTLTAGSFSSTISFAAEGTHVVIVTATDEAGNSASAQRNIVYAKLGDTNDSGTVDLSDVIIALKHALGMELITDPVMLRRCDVAPLGPDGKPAPDGKVDIGDVIIMMRKIVGLVNW